MPKKNDQKIEKRILGNEKSEATIMKKKGVCMYVRGQLYINKQPYKRKGDEKTICKRKGIR
jgi:hypothetical protein